MKRRSKIIIGIAGVTAVALIALVAVFWPPGADEQPIRGDDPVVEVDPTTYEAVVSAFFTGVAALDADANDRAKSALARATELVPEEPAGWLNLGLVGIRLGEYDAAAANLEKAKSLAPDAAAADRLLGLLESRRGRPTDAIAHLRSAVEKDPSDIRAMFALAEEIERQGTEGSDAEVRQLVTQILEQRPNNIAMLVQLARITVKQEDAEGLRDVVARLRPMSAAWTERTQQQFGLVAAAAESGDMRQAVTRVTVLRNLLLAEPVFRASLAEVQLPIGVVGEPVERFLRLPNPAPTPSPPDEGLSFAVEDVQGSPTAGAVVAVPLMEEGGVFLVSADGSEIRVLNSDRPPLTFPGGTPPTPPGPYGLLAVDWDSDYAIDLVCAGAGGLRIYKGDSDGTLTDVTSEAGLSAEFAASALVAVWAADVELDGDLDLVLGPQDGPPDVLQNNGDGTFTPISPFDGAAQPREFAWCDLDANGLPDGIFRDAAGALHVFINERSGRYSRRDLPRDFDAVRGFAVGDQNADGRFDLLVVRDNGAVTRLTAQVGGGWDLAEIARFDGQDPGEIRLLVADLDNNGAIDLVGSSASGSYVLLGDGSDRLLALRDRVASRVNSILDLNGDGRLDFVGLSESGEPAQALNRGTKSYHWQAIRPRGAKVVGDGRINSFGLGGEIEARSGLLVQTQVINGATVHFGLGERPKSDVVRIVWPNGTVQAEFDVQADQVLRAEQRLKGSCPFIYAYDGHAIRFVTDFLWRSPLGLRINAQDTAGIAQTEDRIKIRGDQLVPRDGYYDIRLTAELWETHYFDHVSLLVVDHPEETEVFVDERFARTPPDMSVQLTGPLMPVTARDDNGDDVTETIRATDGRYLDTFGRGRYQGVTRDHWVEVEIGDDVPDDRPLRLIGRGWVHPTDSSINVALAQGRHEPPKGLSLEIPAADGGWKVAVPDLGFPAGKDKTIVVDLDGLFAPGSRRVFRLRTNLEVFWDHLAVAVVVGDDDVRTQQIAPEVADFRHRGYSLMTQADAGSPELPVYEELTGTAQRWRDLEGFYTRYGDVRELLREVDDRYVIANAGDEVAFLFPAPPAPPKGWVRDFVLIGDGWNKDGDFNTAFSGTVLPLPSHDSPSYDTPPGALEDDPVYQRHPSDWVTYHTRYVGSEVFENGLRPHSSIGIDTTRRREGD